MAEGQYELAAELLRFIVPPGDDNLLIGLPRPVQMNGQAEQQGHLCCCQAREGAPQSRVIFTARVLLACTASDAVSLLPATMWALEESLTNNNNSNNYYY